jgi:hypothetical protein
VAAHCVTAAELAVMLAAFDVAGARAGDRIEHGGVIAPAAIGELKRLGLTVVTQPAFILERGDRYLAEVDPAEQNDLYRCASLLAAGVPVAGSSDAPYGSLDPWTALRAAVDRRTRSGAPIGPGERVSASAALGLYLGSFEDPGGPPRRITPGEAADLCRRRGRHLRRRPAGVSRALTGRRNVAPGLESPGFAGKGSGWGTRTRT